MVVDSWRLRIGSRAISDVTMDKLMTGYWKINVVGISQRQTPHIRIVACSWSETVQELHELSSIVQRRLLLGPNPWEENP